jgi:hypothetical protein
MRSQVFNFPEVGVDHRSSIIDHRSQLRFRTMAATSTERGRKHRANKGKSPEALRSAKCRANKKLEQEAKKRSSTMETPPQKQEAPDALTALFQLCTSPLMASNIPAQVKLLSACTSLKLRQECSEKWDEDMKCLVSMLTQSTPESSNHHLSFAEKSPENINSEVIEATVQESKPPEQLTADQPNEPWADRSWWAKPTASVVETVDSDDDYKLKVKRRYN